jgi:double-stranded uracil-DNA glycosylase
VTEGRAKPLRDVVGPGLDVLFCGINPSLVSAEVGHHFARPGNRFWPALHLAGLTPRRFRPEEDAELLRHGLGVTNVVDRPTRTAAELDPAELRAGARALAELVERYRPRVLAVLGVTAWRVAFDRPRAGLGRQPERIGGAETWVAPNPSGLNAHHQLPDLARLYAQLRPAGARGVPAGRGVRAQLVAVDPVPAGTPVRDCSSASSAVSLEWKDAGPPRS